MGMLSLGINGSRLKGLPDRPLQVCPRARGAIPIGYAHTNPPTKKPDQAWAWRSPCLGLGGKPRPLGSQSTTCSSSGLGSCLTCDSSQGPGTRRQAPRHQGSGVPRHHAPGVALLATPTIGSRMGCDIRRQAFLGL
jgi:hypothetical protein